MSVSQVIRKHWPTRETQDSAKVLSRLIDLLRYKYGQTHQDQFAIFKSSIEKTEGNISIADFDEYLNELDGKGF